MIVALDGERLAGPFAADATLQALVDQVREQHLGDRLVVSVAIDGQVLTDQDLVERLPRAVGSVGQVDLTSADRRQLASDTLREVADRLGAAAGEQVAAADKLQAGRAAEAISSFSGFLEIWRTCQRAIVDCSGVLGEDLTALPCKGQRIREHLDGLVDKLRELREAFESRDAVLLADLFRYEVPATCRLWQGILHELAESVAGRVPSAGS